KFYSYTGTGDADIAEVLHHIGPEGTAFPAANPSLLIMKNGALKQYAPGGQFSADADAFTGGLGSSADILIVADPIFNYAQTETDMSIAVTAAPTVALPTDGSTITVTNVVAGSQAQTFFDITTGYFSVAAEKVVHFKFDS